MIERKPFNWDTSNFSWNSNPFGSKQSSNPFTWDDVALIEEVAEVLKGGPTQIDEYFQDKEKKKKFLKLSCKVQGQEFVETKEVIKKKITISEVELVIKEVLSTIKLIL